MAVCQLVLAWDFKGIQGNKYLIPRIERAELLEA